MSIPKKLRFDVLERDDFTCQYCGAKPTDGALHVDHIIAVADGGQTAYENLITSCEPCNSGKGRRKLKARAPLDLKASTEQSQARATEVNAWRAAFAEERRLLSEAIGALRQGYDVSIPEHVIARAIDARGLKEVQYALSVTFDRGIPRTEFERQTAYFSKVLQNRQEQGQAAEQCMFGIKDAVCPAEGCAYTREDHVLYACSPLQDWLADRNSAAMVNFIGDVRHAIKGGNPSMLCLAARVFANEAHRDLCGRCERRGDEA